MVGLPDIATFKLKHTIREGLEVEYTGLSAKSIAALFNRFPQIKQAVAKQSFADLSMDKIIDLVPEIGTAIIAAGTGKPDKEEEAKAALLPFGDQVELAGKIWQATFPKGIDSFLAGLDAFGLSAGFPNQQHTVNGTGRDGSLPLPSTELSKTAVSPQK